MIKKLFIVFIISLYFIANAQEKINDYLLEERYCLELIKDFSDFITENQLDISFLCQWHALIEPLWNETGELILYLNSDNCTILGIEHSDLNNCFPESLGDIYTIKLVTVSDVSTDTLVKMVDILKGRGVRNIAIETLEE